jgi:hypothetical protein
MVGINVPNWIEGIAQDQIMSPGGAEVHSQGRLPPLDRGSSVREPRPEGARVCDSKLSRGRMPPAIDLSPSGANSMRSHWLN